MGVFVPVAEVPIIRAWFSGLIKLNLEVTEKLVRLEQKQQGLIARL